MPSRVFVSTECSQCGGNLNLEEGSNAVSCPYCDSSFLITGYDKILSYYIPKNLEERRAAVQTLVHRYLGSLTVPCRIEGMHLFHLPYYHLRGNIFRLVHQYPEPDQTLHASAAPMTAIQTRYLDRSFLATTLEGLHLYSLGIRTSVLQLKLFQPETLRHTGRVYPVTMSVARALETGRGKANDGSPDTRVTSQILSIVYAPIWEVNIRSIDRDFSIIIDALSETIVEQRASFRILTDHLPEEHVPSCATISFHSLACPNCGWSIPPDAKLFIFVCKNCCRVWECGAQGLRETMGVMVPAPVRHELQHLTYLPFWTFPAAQHISRPYAERTAPVRLFIPAFAVRDLNVIHRIAATFTSAQPSLDLIPLSNDLPGVQIAGAVLRRDDAYTLAALFACNGTQRTPLVPEVGSSGRLVWLPFYEKGIYFRDALLDSGTQKAKF